MRRMMRAAALATWTAAIAAGGASAEEAPDARAAASKFYQHVEVAKCSGGKCTATFAKIPAGKVLQATNVSCNANIGGNVFPAFATLQVGRQILTYIPLNPFSNGDGSGAATGASAGTVYAPARSEPIAVIPVGAQSATCTLSGALASD